MLYHAIKLIKAVYGNPKAGHTHGGFPPILTTISWVKVPVDQTQKLVALTDLMEIQSKMPWSGPV